MTLTNTASFTAWSESARVELTAEGGAADGQGAPGGLAPGLGPAGEFSPDLFPRGSPLVVSWGAGEDGQLGIDNNFRDEQALHVVPALADKHITALVAGSRNSLAISATGQVFLWGWNQRSTLGHSFEEKKLPKESQPSMALKGVKVAQAAVGGWHVLALSEGGTAFAWGGNEYGQCGKKPDRTQGSSSFRDIRLPITCASHLRVRQVAAGGMHSLVLTEQGEVWTWGQPWPPANNKDGYMATRVPGLAGVARVVAGAFHNVALLGTGEVFTWGDNEHGQLGTGTTQPRSHPQPIRELAQLQVVDIAAGGWHTMAVTASGQLWAWGRGEHGRLMLGEDKASKMTPLQVATLAEEVIVQVSCGGTHSVALTLDGRMFACGRKDNGRLGPLGQVTSGTPLRVPLPGDPLLEDEHGEVPYPLRAAKVSCGGRHTLALVCHEGELDMHRKDLPWYAARGRTEDRAGKDDGRDVMKEKGEEEGEGAGEETGVVVEEKGVVVEEKVVAVEEKVVAVEADTETVS